jgi:hypothetical protein
LRSAIVRDEAATRKRALSGASGGTVDILSRSVAISMDKGAILLAFVKGSVEVGRAVAAADAGPAEGESLRV